MVTFAEGVAAISALRTALDMTKALKDVDDTVRRNSAVIELQGQILEAQQALGELIQKNRDLENQISESDKWNNQKKRYQLRDYGSNTFAYELKPECAEGEPPHRACPTCFQNEKISILQFNHISQGQHKYSCHTCNNHFMFGQRTRTERTFPRPSAWAV